MSSVQCRHGSVRLVVIRFVYENDSYLICHLSIESIGARIENDGRVKSSSSVSFQNIAAGYVIGVLNFDMHL